MSTPHRRRPDAAAAADPLRWPVARAWTALLLERLWPALVPALTAAGLVAAAALSGVLPRLGFWGHAAVLGAGGLAVAALLVRGLARLRPPTRAQALRRLEAATGLQHRPLATLGERMVGNDNVSRALWAEHRRRMTALARDLKAGAPLPPIAERDPRALRALSVVVLAAAVIAAGPDGRARLADGLSPDIAALADAEPTLDLWITPPAYTGAPPVFATLGAAGETLRVPKGSRLAAQVSRAGDAPILTMGAAETPFAAAGDQGWRIEAPVEAGDRLAVRLGRRELRAWPLEVVPDAPPTIALRQPPGASQRFALRLDHDSADDYGLDRMSARIVRPDRPERGVIELSLGAPAGSRKTVSTTTYHDLTTHPWAGLEVELTLSVSDQAGQTGGAGPIRLRLPERPFRHPVARAIINERRRLADEPEQNRAEVVDALGGIAARPGAYGEDVVIFLGLVTGLRRLNNDPGPDAVAAVQSLLWDLAVRLDEGQAGLAEADLRALEEALREALERGAPDEEIERLMAELERAMQRYMQALMEQALREGRQLERPQGEGGERQFQTIEQRDLQRMMEQARDALRRGDRQRAQELLSQLRQIMENLRAGIEQEQDSDAGSEARRAMDELNSLSRRQRELMERSFRNSGQQQGRQPGQQGQRGQGQRGQQGQQGQGQQGQGQQGPGGQPGDGDGLAADQERLRRDLGDFMRRLDEMGGRIPEGLGRAEGSMRDAERALGQGQPGDAVGPQGEALEQMRNAARNLMDQFSQQRGQGQGDALSDQRGQPRRPDGRPQRQDQDPLGRAQRLPEGGTENGDLDVPVGDAVRARAIVEELRRRAADPNRPQIEREYLDRLLRQF